jgi:Ca-activated chloride channel family protein
VVTGRYAGTATGAIAVTGRTRAGEPFSTTVPVEQREEPAITAQWARARLRDLEDAYAAGDHGLERRIVATSLRFGVLCRFTAFVAVDSRVVNEDGETRRVTQPVEYPSGWETPYGDTGAPPMLLASAAAPLPPPAPGGPMPQRFGPVQAAMPRGSARRQMKTFAAVPGMVAGGGAPRATSSGLSIEDIRRLAAVEAGRLRESKDLPAYERREVLSDLASRLRVLVAGQGDARYDTLRDLAERIDDDRDLEARWSEAIAVLEAFGGPAPREPGRRAFWKR